jgi:hypothetical protein
MGWITGGAILAGSLIGADASRSAANTQSDAANRAAQLQQQMFQQTQQNLAPWMQTGQVALSELGQRTTSGGDLNQPFTLDKFQQSPAYQFNLEQGQQAINKGAAARGGFYQPGTLQDIAKFSQGLASNEFQNAFSNYNTNQNNIWNRLYGLSGSGQNAAANLGGFAGTAAGNIGNSITGGANAQAAGQVGQANALTGALGQGYNAYMMQQLLGRNQQGVGWNPYQSYSGAGTGQADFAPGYY